MANVPHQWQSFDKLPAAQLNENFQYLCDLFETLPVTSEGLVLRMVELEQKCAQLEARVAELEG